MFIKQYFKHNRTTDERYTVYKLCEGYRKNGGVCHHIIINFGRLESLETVEQKKLLASRVEQFLVNGGNTLSSSVTDEHVEQLARHYYNEIKDKKDQPIELLKVKSAGDNDQYLWVRSQTKAMKEKSMNGLFSQRFEEGIQSIQEGLSKKSGTKKLNKVYERIGRLKEKYPSVHN